MISRNWWVTSEGRSTIGPVSTELLIEGIKAKKVPHDSLVCEVGASRWQPLGEITEFRDALVHGRRSRPEELARDRLSPSEAPTTRLPLRVVNVGVARVEENNVSEERTIVTDPPFRVSEPAGAPDEGEDRTLVDVQRPSNTDDPQS